MSHSVRSHLRLEIDSYDETIRRFIPRYDDGLTKAASEIAAIQPKLVLDLGVGTGALSEKILEHSLIAVVEAIDVDPEMLEQAGERLARFGDRIRFREASFDAALPRCDAVAASLALHHVRTLTAKAHLFARIFDALRPGGLFVNADVTMSANTHERALSYQRWAEHMAACGIESRRAQEHFDAWAEEDTYFPMDDELAALRSAGFQADCVWRCCPNSLLVGRKH